MYTETFFEGLSPVHTNKIGIEIRTENDLSPNDLALVEKACFDKKIPLESWCVIGTNQQQAYSTHGLFRYFGKFPPSIATHLICEYTNLGDIVIDPMSGSGSTAVECLHLNRKCLANDINPLCQKIITVKTTQLDRNSLLSTLAYIEENYKPLSYDEYNFIPNDCNYEHWFLPETCDSLRGLKYIISTIDDKKIENFFEIIFASIIRRVSKATTQQGRLFLDVETAVADAFPFFKKKALKEIENINNLPVDNSFIQIINDDIREIQKHKYKGKAQLVILHPPYFNSYKYSSINCLESGWLDFQRSEVRPHEIREFFKVGKPEKFIEYVDDMEDALNNSLSFLKKDGVLALMIGDTVIKGKYIPVTNTLISRIDSKKYKVEKIAIRVPRYTEASWVTSQRRKANGIGITINDFIIIIRKR